MGRMPSGDEVIARKTAEISVSVYMHVYVDITVGVEIQQGKLFLTGIV